MTKLRRALLGSLFGILSVLATVSPVQAQDGLPFSLRFVDHAAFPSGHRTLDFELGGLSGIEYLGDGGVRYALISDDRGRRGGPRVYEAHIPFDDAGFGPINFVTVDPILDQDGTPFGDNVADPEAIRYVAETNTFLWTSEGDTPRNIQPFVREMTRRGDFVRELEVPAGVIPLPDRDWGARQNLAFESLTVDPDDGGIWTATENALAQDGPVADLGVRSPVRVVRFDPESGRVTAVYSYLVEAVPVAPLREDGFRTNGLVEMLALGGGEFLMLERAFATGSGNRVRIYWATIAGASDVQEVDKLPNTVARGMSKRLLFDLSHIDLAAHGFRLDNLEGMTFGAPFPNGDRSLILVSDNNFNWAAQETQFLLFRVDERG